MRLIFTLIIILLVGCKVSNANEMDSLLVQLEKQMARRAIYDAAIIDEISRIKLLASDSNLSVAMQYQLNRQLILTYKPFVFDSAMHYLDKNLKLSYLHKNKAWEIESKIQLAYLLATSGRYKDAVDLLHSVTRSEVPESMVIDYLGAYQKVYSILSFYTPLPEYEIKYYALYEQYTDSILPLLDTNSEAYLSIKETELRDHRQLNECLQINSKRLTLSQLEHRNFSLVTFERSLAYELLGDTENQKKYLILSAISDIKNSVKDNASMATLARILYNENQLMQAYRFINFSYEDASFYNSRLRVTEISSILPIISDAYRLKDSKQKKAMRLLLMLISILSVGLFVTVLYIYKQMKRLAFTQGELRNTNLLLKNLNNDLNEANNKLNESNKVKEHYIGNFLSICSNYIDKLDTYRKMVNKHLVNKQLAELLDKTKSRELIEMETQAFYDNFDTTFLHIFPNFVERMNALLIESEQIVLKNNEHLNTELRIFALIRLGISDSTQIATLLRYSVRTIYNYRTRIKNNAKISRDDFESEVMKIGAFLA